MATNFKVLHSYFKGNINKKVVLVYQIYVGNELCYIMLYSATLCQFLNFLNLWHFHWIRAQENGLRIEVLRDRQSHLTIKVYGRPAKRPYIFIWEWNTEPSQIGDFLIFYKTRQIKNENKYLFSHNSFWYATKQFKTCDRRRETLAQIQNHLHRTFWKYIG